MAAAGPSSCYSTTRSSDLVEPEASSTSSSCTMRLGGHTRSAPRLSVQRSYVVSRRNRRQQPEEDIPVNVFGSYNTASSPAPMTSFPSMPLLSATTTTSREILKKVLCTPLPVETITEAQEGTACQDPTTSLDCDAIQEALLTGNGGTARSLSSPDPPIPQNILQCKVTLEPQQPKQELACSSVIESNTLCSNALELHKRAEEDVKITPDVSSLMSYAAEHDLSSRMSSVSAWRKRTRPRGPFTSCEAAHSKIRRETTSCTRKSSSKMDWTAEEYTQKLFSTYNKLVERSSRVSPSLIFESVLHLWKTLNILHRVVPRWSCYTGGTALSNLMYHRLAVQGAPSLACLFGYYAAVESVYSSIYHPEENSTSFDMPTGSMSSGLCGLTTQSAVVDRNQLEPSLSSRSVSSGSLQRNTASLPSRSCLFALASKVVDVLTFLDLIRQQRIEERRPTVESLSEKLLLSLGVGRDASPCLPPSTDSVFLSRVAIPCLFSCLQDSWFQSQLVVDDVEPNVSLGLHDHQRTTPSSLFQSAASKCSTRLHPSNAASSFSNSYKPLDRSALLCLVDLEELQKLRLLSQQVAPAEQPHTSYHTSLLTQLLAAENSTRIKSPQHPQQQQTFSYPSVSDVSPVNCNAKVEPCSHGLASVVNSPTTVHIQGGKDDLSGGDDCDALVDILDDIRAMLESPSYSEMPRTIEASGNHFATKGGQTRSVAIDKAAGSSCKPKESEVQNEDLRHSSSNELDLAVAALLEGIDWEKLATHLGDAVANSSTALGDKSPVSHMSESTDHPESAAFKGETMDTLLPRSDRSRSWPLFSTRRRSSSSGSNHSNNSLNGSQATDRGQASALEEQQRCNENTRNRSCVSIKKPTCRSLFVSTTSNGTDDTEHLSPFVVHGPSRGEYHNSQASAATEDVTSDVVAWHVRQSGSNNDLSPRLVSNKKRKMSAVAGVGTVAGAQHRHPSLSPVLKQLQQNPVSSATRTEMKGGGESSSYDTAATLDLSTPCQGVCWDPTHQRWVAHWSDSKTHQRIRKYFNPKLLGFERARLHAILTRKEAVDSGRASMMIKSERPRRGVGGNICRDDGTVDLSSAGGRSSNFLHHSSGPRMLPTYSGRKSAQRRSASDNILYSGYSLAGPASNGLQQHIECAEDTSDMQTMTSDGDATNSPEADGYFPGVYWASNEQVWYSHWKPPDAPQVQIAAFPVTRFLEEAHDNYAVAVGLARDAALQHRLAAVTGSPSSTSASQSTCIMVPSSPPSLMSSPSALLSPPTPPPFARSHPPAILPENNTSVQDQLLSSHIVQPRRRTAPSLSSCPPSPCSRPQHEVIMNDEQNTATPNYTSPTSCTAVAEATTTPVGAQHVGAVQTSEWSSFSKRESSEHNTSKTSSDSASLGPKKQHNKHNQQQAPNSTALSHPTLPWSQSPAITAGTPQHIGTTLSPETVTRDNVSTSNSENSSSDAVLYKLPRFSLQASANDTCHHRAEFTEPLT